MKRKLIWNFELSTGKSSDLTTLVAADQGNLKWEIRYFWPANADIALHATDNSLLDLANYQRKTRTDTYYLLPDCDYNIKQRNDALLYKPVIAHRGSALGFGSKINLAEESALNLPMKALYEQAKSTGQPVLVEKEAFIYKFPTIPVTKLELARLKINNICYFSACIEGKSFFLVETLNERLLDKHLSCDYVSFLKNTILYNE